MPPSRQRRYMGQLVTSRSASRTVAGVGVDHAAGHAEGGRLAGAVGAQAGRRSRRARPRSRRRRRRGGGRSFSPGRERVSSDIVRSSMTGWQSGGRQSASAEAIGASSSGRQPTANADSLISPTSYLQNSGSPAACGSPGMPPQEWGQNTHTALPMSSRRSRYRPPGMPRPSFLVHRRQSALSGLLSPMTNSCSASIGNFTSRRVRNRGQASGCGEQIARVAERGGRDSPSTRAMCRAGRSPVYRVARAHVVAGGDVVHVAQHGQPRDGELGAAGADADRRQVAVIAARPRSPRESSAAAARRRTAPRDRTSNRRIRPARRRPTAAAGRRRWRTARCTRRRRRSASWLRPRTAAPRPCGRR